MTMTQSTITPGELRIGNLFMSVKFQVPVVCDLTDLYELCIRSDGATNDPPISEMFEPIPLTEEWLEKLGLYQTDLMGYPGVYVTDDEPLYFFQPLRGKPGVIIHLIFESGTVGLTKAWSVNQFQNLFFFLTGKELPLNNIKSR